MKAKLNAAFGQLHGGLDGGAYGRLTAQGSVIYTKSPRRSLGRIMAGRYPVRWETVDLEWHYTSEAWRRVWSAAGSRYHQAGYHWFKGAYLTSPDWSMVNASWVLSVRRHRWVEPVAPLVPVEGTFVGVVDDRGNGPIGVGPTMTFELALVSSTPACQGDGNTDTWYGPMPVELVVDVDPRWTDATHKWVVARCDWLTHFWAPGGGTLLTLEAQDGDGPWRPVAQMWARYGTGSASFDVVGNADRFRVHATCTTGQGRLIDEDYSIALPPAP